MALYSKRIDIKASAPKLSKEEELRKKFTDLLAQKFSSYTEQEVMKAIIVLAENIDLDINDAELLINFTNKNSGNILSYLNSGIISKNIVNPISLESVKPNFSGSSEIAEEKEVLDINSENMPKADKETNGSKIENVVSLDKEKTEREIAVTDGLEIIVSSEEPKPKFKRGRRKKENLILENEKDIYIWNNFLIVFNDLIPKYSLTKIIRALKLQAFSKNKINVCNLNDLINTISDNESVLEIESIIKKNVNIHEYLKKGLDDIIFINKLEFDIATTNVIITPKVVNDNALTPDQNYKGLLEGESGAIEKVASDVLEETIVNEEDEYNSGNYILAEKEKSELDIRVSQLFSLPLFDNSLMALGQEKYMILAMHLGFINGRKYTFDQIAKCVNKTTVEVIEILKEIFNVLNNELGRFIQNNLGETRKRD